ncbi:unnamed protein product, partial [Ceratitis capitata]
MESENELQKVSIEKSVNAENAAVGSLKGKMSSLLPKRVCFCLLALLFLKCGELFTYTHHLQKPHNGIFN